MQSAIVMTTTTTKTLQQYMTDLLFASPKPSALNASFASTVTDIDSPIGSEQSDGEDDIQQSIADDSPISPVSPSSAPTQASVTPAASAVQAIPTPAVMSAPAVVASTPLAPIFADAIVVPSVTPQPSVSVSEIESPPHNRQHEEVSTHTTPRKQSTKSRSKRKQSLSSSTRAAASSPSSVALLSSPDSSSSDDPAEATMADCQLTQDTDELKRWVKISILKTIAVDLGRKLNASAYQIIKYYKLVWLGQRNDIYQAVTEQRLHKLTCTQSESDAQLMRFTTEITQLESEQSVLLKLKQRLLQTIECGVELMRTMPTDAKECKSWCHSACDICDQMIGVLQTAQHITAIDFSDEQKRLRRIQSQLQRAVRICVRGPEKAGKSTTIDGTLDCSILPTGPAPCTMVPINLKIRWRSSVSADNNSEMMIHYNFADSASPLLDKEEALQRKKNEEQAISNHAKKNLEDTLQAHISEWRESCRKLLVDNGMSGQNVRIGGSRSDIAKALREMCANDKYLSFAIASVDVILFSSDKDTVDMDWVDSTGWDSTTLIHSDHGMTAAEESDVFLFFRPVGGGQWELTNFEKGQLIDLKDKSADAPECLIVVNTRMSEENPAGVATARECLNVEGISDAQIYFPDTRLSDSERWYNKTDRELMEMESLVQFNFMQREAVRFHLWFRRFIHERLPTIRRDKLGQITAHLVHLMKTALVDTSKRLNEIDISIHSIENQRAIIQQQSNGDDKESIGLAIEFQREITVREATFFTYEMLEGSCKTATLAEWLTRALKQLPLRMGEHCHPIGQLKERTHEDMVLPHTYNYTKHDVMRREEIATAHYKVIENIADFIAEFARTHLEKVVAKLLDRPFNGNIKSLLKPSLDVKTEKVMSRHELKGMIMQTLEFLTDLNAGLVLYSRGDAFGQRNRYLGMCSQRLPKILSDINQSDIIDIANECNRHLTSENKSKNSDVVISMDDIVLRIRDVDDISQTAESIRNDWFARVVGLTSRASIDLRSKFEKLVTNILHHPRTVDVAALTYALVAVASTGTSIEAAARAAKDVLRQETRQ